MNFFGLGKVLYHCYHVPRKRVKEINTQGWSNHILGEIGRRQMVRAAYRQMPTSFPQSENSGKPIRVHFLTGSKHWFQTVFCATSLERCAKRQLQPVIHSDGSLEERHVARLKEIFPLLEVDAASMKRERLEVNFPPARFPNLRKAHDSYVYIRKILNIYTHTPGWFLYLDSDMLFFKTPTELLGWYDNPDAMLYMLDRYTNYGPYTKELTQKLVEKPLLPAVNAGILGINGNAIDWDKMEHWVGALLAEKGVHYHLEQLLNAMIISSHGGRHTNPAEYIIHPEGEEGLRPSATMHHYTWYSKLLLYRHHWRRYANA